MEGLKVMDRLSGGERWGWGKGEGRPILSKLFRPLSEKEYTLKDITKIYLYDFDSLKPHFYIPKLRFTGVYIIFLISAQTHRLWVLDRTESARRF